MRHDPVRRLTLLVFVGTFLFYLPFLGSYGLFDPWETHYSEVARSMIQQDDYISTFWQDNVITSYSIHYTKLYEMAVMPMRKRGATLRAILRMAQRIGLVKM